MTLVPVGPGAQQVAEAVEERIGVVVGQRRCGIEPERAGAP